MSLLPVACVKSKVDQTRSRFEWKRQFEVSPTANILEEGSVLRRVANAAGTSEVVELCTSAGAGQLVAGISLQSSISAVSFTEVEERVVPTAAPYTIQLKHYNPIDVGAGVAEATAWDSDAGPAAYLTVIAPGVPAATQVAINTAGGLATFNAAEAGHRVKFIYRYTMTTIERDEMLRQSHINRGAESQFGLMLVGYGNCWVYTSEYDASQQYTVGDQLTTGDNGLFSKGGATNFGRVFSVPAPGDPYLGVEYTSLP